MQNTRKHNVLHVACRRMRTLTALELEVVGVDVPALCVVSSQLISLQLVLCRLRTGAGPGASTDLFESGWGSLNRLSLESSFIDAPLGSVNMPQLQELEVGNFLVVRRPPEIVRIDSFLKGCPDCRYVLFEAEYLNASTVSSSCKELTSLKDVHVVWDAMAMLRGVAWPAQPLPCVKLPPSVTSLRCSCHHTAYKPSAVLSYIWDHAELDLHTMLGMAAGCIAAGVPLQTLILEDCATYVGKVGGAKGQPTAEQIALFRPVCAALRGLRTLSLLRINEAWLEGCSLEAVNAVVSSAPDLRAIAFKIPELWRTHSEVQVVQCRGLTELDITLNLEFMMQKYRQYGPVDTLVALELQNAACLQKCSLLITGELGVYGGHVVRVSFDTPLGAKVTAVAHDRDKHHVPLHIRVAGQDDRAVVTLQQAELRRATVSFEWGVCSAAEEDVRMGWDIAVQ